MGRIAELIGNFENLSSPERQELIERIHVLESLVESTSGLLTDAGGIEADGTIIAPRGIRIPTALGANAANAPGIRWVTQSFGGAEAFSALGIFAPATPRFVTGSRLPTRNTWEFLAAGGGLQGYLNGKIAYDAYESTIDTLDHVFEFKKPSGGIARGRLGLHRLPGVFASSFAEGVFTNRTDWFDIFSETVFGHTLGSTHVLHVYLHCTEQNTLGTTQTITFRVDWGGTILTTPAKSIPNGTTERVANLRCTLAANAATNAQKIMLQYEPTNTVFVRGTAALDSTQAQTLKIQGQWNAASTSLIWRRFAMFAFWFDGT